MAATSAGMNSLAPCSSRSSWPMRRAGSASGMARACFLKLELRDERQVVRHAPPDAALRDLDTHRFHAPGIHVIELRERQAGRVGPLALAAKIAQARLVHRRAQ